MVSAYCCSSPAFCADGSESSIWECCAYGSCNIFCCNCDGGCITASKKRSWTDWGHGRGCSPFPGAFDADEVCPATISDDQCVIDKLDALDGNLDGRVSLAEVLASPDIVRPLITQLDLDPEDIKVKMTELFNIFDTNKDGYLDLAEASARQVVKISK
ncbi:hypothetical protein PV08_04154 [Exophiala spinifera]|uniref:EF-hand domain-containing protein n=1 Tax=Exophiala spinifera TaxID=91928 RepID=A0A0D2BDF0_9EURO|nr:uncharacterized protein PV08_04154 [Exophiala spinifera]KIW16963.1 hypothetical protein PV08_04154 [Exophiala spinifera]